ncbi:hypothetical protein DOTSEDRAFT_72452 [Dothistroma septosporum NZE10]|uniref:FAD-binding domain-containing protein n=1 Tax=Dothistroma septosporum (strain NZE10 / CBS 128990) TaxID=675120 RepID=M2YMC6_DOTSN|nr:hypothetical protein DOTSEDRAFT_72452 [Dothistroma septosporum NZE10]
MIPSRKREAQGQNGYHDNPKAQKHDTNMSPGRLQGRHGGPEEDDYDVAVVGAGPAGLMLAANLVRFGVKTVILDDRPHKTSTGRADGLQPKTIETLRQMRLADGLLKRGARIHDICFWSSSPESSMRRTHRDVHYPPVVDLLDPYILLVHQGMVEDVFLRDLEDRSVGVRRSAPFLHYEKTPGQERALNVRYDDQGSRKTIRADYLVGCDGAHSQVRKCIPDAIAEGSSSEAIWGVLDGEIDTDFPDLWSKAVAYSHKYGNVLCIPRERNLTRLYIELKSEDGERLPKEEATQEYVMERAKAILSPYTLSWRTIEWFGIYQVGQRVASRFSDPSQHVFIAGDASHTHSPKAAQGMNTSMHDSLNLAWKLNLAIRGLAKPELLLTYEDERRKIAKDLIEFDYEHANAFHDGDPTALAKNFLKNVKFISGVGAEYNANILSRQPSTKTVLQPGSLLTPARVTRYIDANPVDIQLDIPMLGQFRMYFLSPDLVKALPFLHAVCASISVMLASNAQAELSYLKKPRSWSDMESYVRPDRYLASSQLFTPAIVTGSHKDLFEIDNLPRLLKVSKWTVYLDNVPEQSTNGKHCLQKWIGDMTPSEVALINVRPDGYVGSLGRWDTERQPDVADEAASWVQEYYTSFLSI